MMLLCSTTWILSYSVLVLQSYEGGDSLFRIDRLWRIAVGIIPASLAAMTFLSWRCRHQLASLTVWRGLIVLLTLIVITMVALAAMVVFLRDARA